MSEKFQRVVLRLYGATTHVIRVTDIEPVSETYVRIRFSTDDMFDKLEVFPTAWIRLWVPDTEKDGVFRQRGYTLVDAKAEEGTFALEFVMHEPAGAASAWAKTAKVGDELEVSLTPQKLEPEHGLSAYVLVGDSSAVPAFNSILDDLPDDSPVNLVLVNDNPGVEQLLRLGVAAKCTLVGSEAEAAAAVRALKIDPADAYGWAAGERRLVAEVKPIFRREWSLPKTRQHTQYYWMRGKPFG